MNGSKTGIITISIILLFPFFSCVTALDPVNGIDSPDIPIETAEIFPSIEIPVEKEPLKEEVIKEETTEETVLTVTEIEQTKTDIMEQEIRLLLQKMTIDEKIGQLFILSVRNTYYGKRMLYADKYLSDIIDKYKPGGFILFAINFETPEQTRALIRDMQALSDIPLFIAVDEEGGRVARLGNTGKMSVTLLPPAAVIGKTGDTENAEKAAGIIAVELKALGFNMNMAPIADVNTNPANTVIGDRTYSDDPVEAGVMAAAAAQSMQAENIIAVLKHFPGHGDTNADTHSGAVVLNHSKEHLDEVEFVPFKTGIDAGADAVMTAHIKLPQITDTDLPATMSPVILTDILRGELGFGGIIITDSMDMGAVKNYWQADEAAVNAMKAGIDIILMPEDIQLAVSGIKKAVESGVLSIRRINESVSRILKLKYKRNILHGGIPGADNLDEILGNEEHQEIINTILQSR